MWDWRNPVRFTVIAVALTLLNIRSATGHGRLIEPPSRASAWRFGFQTPHNYNDHELYCGGFSRQWNKNGGKCGVCGDAWDQKTPRPHEYGGRFGQGVIVRKYLINTVITIKVELTANHNGYFEFRLCPQVENTTQECLDQNVLEQYIPEGNQGVVTKYYPKEGNKIYEMQYKLPKDFLCEHCVLQWRYIAGNNWGNCPDGTGAVGCGPQEEFRACADVGVGLTAEPVIPGTTTRPRPTYVYPTRKTTTSKTADESSTATTDLPIPEERGSSWVSVLIAAVTLLAVLISFLLFYFYYYRGGHRIKNLLMKKTKPAPPPPPPVRPPRTKKITTANMNDVEDNMNGEFKTDIDNNIEPGFETIKLNDNKI